MSALKRVRHARHARGPQSVQTVKMGGMDAATIISLCCAVFMAGLSLIQATRRNPPLERELEKYAKREDLCSLATRLEGLRQDMRRDVGNIYEEIKKGNAANSNMFREISADVARIEGRLR